MAVMVLPDAALFHQLREETRRGREARTFNVPTSPSLGEITNATLVGAHLAGKAADMAAVPMAGISEHMRRQREAEMIAQHNESRMGELPMGARAARSEGETQLPPSQGYESADVNPMPPPAQRYGIATSIDPHAAPASIVPQLPSQTPEADQVDRNDTMFRHAEPGISAFYDRIAARKAAALMPKSLPPEAPTVAAPAISQPQPMRSPMRQPMRQSEPEPMPNRVEPMLTLDQIRRLAAEAGLRNDPAMKSEVLRHYEALGDAAHAPQTWEEFFNPSLAKRRTLDELVGHMSPKQHGLDPMQVANFQSQILARAQLDADRDARLEESKRRNAEVEGQGERRLGQGDKRLGLGERNTVVNESLAPSRIGLNNAQAAQALGNEGLSGARTESEPIVTGARVMGAKAQAMNARASMIRALALKKKIDADLKNGGSNPSASELKSIATDVAKLAADEERIKGKLQGVKARKLPNVPTEAFRDPNGTIKAKRQKEESAQLEELKRLEGELQGVLRQRATHRTRWAQLGGDPTAIEQLMLSDDAQGNDGEQPSE